MEWHTSYAWFAVTVLLFAGFAGWVWHEYRSVGKREYSPPSESTTTH